MRSRLLSVWESLRYSYWFVPSLMTMAAAALAFAMAWVDRTLEDRWITEAQWLYSGSAEGARSLLSTLASSMMTVAGVVFSITIVALSLTSTQFGPRLLRNFMRDPGNQITLGAFLATFVYCLLVVRTIRADYVPHASVTAAVVLALASLGVLIYFIHHAASSIQAPNVIANVAEDLDLAIERLFPEPMGAEADPNEPAGSMRAPADLETNGRSVYAAGTGYVQAIDVKELIASAEQRDVVVRVVCRPGHFVVRDQPLAEVWPGTRCDRELTEAVRGTFVMGLQRSLAQDVEFAIDQLVEVAVRALSPGINDPFTAIQCVERLGAALVRLAGRRMPSPFRLDEHGRLRVIAYPVTFEALVDAAFNQVRQHGRASVAVSMTMLEMIALVAKFVHRTSDREALASQARMIERQSRDAVPEARDRADVRRLYEAAIAALVVHPEEAVDAPVRQQMP